MFVHSMRRNVYPAVAVAVAAAMACADPSASSPPPAALMLGEWRYASVAATRDTPTLNSGVHVTIVVDSVDGTRFHGRVTEWFTGDVGVSLDAFGPVTGSVDGDGAVMVAIDRAAPAAATLTIVGTVAGDTLTVRASWLGADPGPFPAGTWFERVRRSPSLPGGDP